jgi:hypothetical protein
MKNMHQITRVSLLLTLLLALLLTGCLSMGKTKQENALKSALHSYNMTLRWGRIENAYGMLEPELLAKTTIPTNFSNIRVIGYEVLSGPTNLSETSATQTVAILFVYRDRQIQRQILDQQLWEYNPENETWHRANPIPEFR